MGFTLTTLVSLMYFHYNGGFAFAPPVRRYYGEGSFPPCISNVRDERRESLHAYVTYRLYVGAIRAK
eukprot:15082224-Ditylum_brightwellii.AAC.1